MSLRQSSKELFKAQNGKCAVCGASLQTFLTLNGKLLCPDCYNVACMRKEPTTSSAKYLAANERRNILCSEPWSLREQQLIDESGVEQKQNVIGKEKNLNSLTPVSVEKNLEKEKVEKVYEWSCMLTTEQKEDSANYFWTPDGKALLRRLECSKGNMIAVLGLQGSGKTALRQALELQLANKDYNVFSLKWVGNVQENFIERIREQQDAEYLDRLMATLFEEESPKVVGQRPSFSSMTADVNDVSEKIVKRLGLSNSALKFSISSYLMNFYSRGGLKRPDEDKEISRIDIFQILPLVERALGQAKIEKIKNEFLKEKLETADTLLVDMPDYDRNNRREMSRDFTNLQAWWENVLTDQFEGYTQNINLVLFFQKELFHGHFFMGKLDVYELKPLTPDELLKCYKNLFQSFDPFTEDALSEIAVLSRGIFRRFKKYVRICLDHYFSMNFDFNTLTHKITVENVNQWITLDQLIKDMELELMTIFPRERENRVLSVKLLRLLRERGPINQSNITQEVFDGALMKASRVLDRLESWGYIKRERTGKEKTVTLT
jgi:hypothetical protein